MKFKLRSIRLDKNYKTVPVGQRELDLPVETAGPEEGGVEGVLPVGGHDDLDVCRLVESVHLVEQLEEDALHLPVGAGLRVETLRRDRVDLVDEDDGWGVLLGKPEDENSEVLVI